jgi:ABC-type Mn2+/Zn2+ transport system ATPase subunit
MGRAVHLGLTGRMGPRDWAAVHQAMETLNIAELADRPLTDLSGGQRRRVLLARAIAQDPQILVLDEPFQAIDQTTRKALVHALDHLRHQGKTALVVHHNLMDVQDLFDRVALVNGAQSCVGRPAEVFKSAAFYEAFGEPPAVVA